MSGLRTNDACPECGTPVWPDIEMISRRYAKQYARIETSFYAACLALVMCFACGPFGILVAVWAVVQGYEAVRYRNSGVVNTGARNIPFVSLGLSIVALIVSLLAMAAWIGLLL